MRNLAAILGSIVTLVGSASSCSTKSGSCSDLPPDRSVVVTSAQACSLAAQASPSPPIYNPASIPCPAACSDRDACDIDLTYLAAFNAANPVVDAGPTTAHVDGAPVCPAVATNKVPVLCSTFCEGRRTAGVREADARAGSLGEYFATCAYLEAVSVIAFARMYDELSAHDCPPALLERVNRARLEEERHVELTSALARRYGHEPALPDEAAIDGTRSLGAIAHENAVEGCVRETWGAMLATLRAARASDDAIRACAREIASDETRHAELAWEIHDWMRPRLSQCERDSINRAVRTAVLELEGDVVDLADIGMPTANEKRAILRLLDERVFSAA